MERLQGWIGRKDRYAVDAFAVAHRPDGSTATVKLTNFSDEGCRVESEESFTIGEMVELAIPELGTVEAQVRWALPGSAGMRFLVDGDL
jgi:hypothetical protein